MTDSASVLAHWSHLCCNTCVAVCEVWKIPSVGGGNLVQLEVPASSSSRISFPVLHNMADQVPTPCPAQYSLQLVDSVGILWCKENI